MHVSAGTQLECRGQADYTGIVPGTYSRHTESHSYLAITDPIQVLDIADLVNRREPRGLEQCYATAANCIVTRNVEVMNHRESDDS